MDRRDTERVHRYSAEIFKQLEIYEIQGLLKEGEEFNCGIEAYQVKDFSLVSFAGFNCKEEIARFNFCLQLKIPYYIIVTAEDSRRYRIYNSEILGNTLTYQTYSEYSEVEFVGWWKDKQNFTQKKAMYNAADRIKNSLIDVLLFSNSLAWGVNVDGFSIDKQSGKVNAIYEKRICSYNPPKYTVSNYDPNKFFHGTYKRSGDFPSWDILFRLSVKLNVPLFLLTFDTSENNYIGATRIINVNKNQGLTYMNNKKPFDNIFYDDINCLKRYIN